ncbi:MAG: T9SS type A sorting domain-containing protein, partial [Prolixibacteraceae bacterium]|nr:T9SS type A sorting domain-containing protein [Prolixibacteraceae bacterium]
GLDVIDFTNPTGLSWPDDITIHHKFAVVDYDYPESDPLVITGTHNWSASAESRNDENTLILHDQQLAKEYFDETAIIYSASGGGNSVENLNDALSIYPNPVSTLLNIQSDELISNYLIFDASGKMLAGKNHLDRKFLSIDVSGYQKGIYLLRLTTAKKGITIRRFVVH